MSLAYIPEHILFSRKGEGERQAQKKRREGGLARSVVFMVIIMEENVPKRKSMTRVICKFWQAP